MLANTIYYLNHFVQISSTSSYDQKENEKVELLMPKDEKPEVLTPKEKRQQRKIEKLQQDLDLVRSLSQMNIFIFFYLNLYPQWMEKEKTIYKKYKAEQQARKKLTSTILYILNTTVDDATNEEQISLKKFKMMVQFIPSKKKNACYSFDKLGTIWFHTRFSAVSIVHFHLSLTKIKYVQISAN